MQRYIVGGARVDIVAAEKAKAEPVAEVETRVVETDPELPLNYQSQG